MITDSAQGKFRGAARLLLVSVTLFVTACSTAPVSRQYLANQQDVLVDIINESKPAFGKRPDITPPEQLHTLTDSQLDDFFAYLNAPERNHIPRHQRVYDYLKTLTDSFDYYEQTLPASNALAMKSGNCMSLAVLTTALAQAAGIEIGYRLMEDLPVFEYQGQTVIKGVHLSTILYRAGWTPPDNDVGFVRRPGLQVDYFPSSRTTMVANVAANDYMAMYYQNVAVEFLEMNQVDTAFWYAVESLSYKPIQAEALNTLAVVHRRKGELKQAEQIYQFGLANVKDKLGLLRNYHALLTFQGRTQDADAIAQQLELMDDSSPFHWLALAHDAELENDFDSAIRYYRKVLDQAPYMHEVHLSIALANYRAGHLVAAEQALSKAIDAVPAPDTRNLYQAKRELLAREMMN